MLPRLSASEFAQLLGVSPALVTSWMDAGMPAQRTGRQRSGVLIQLEQALPWVFNHRTEPPGSQRERLAKEQADKLALENSRKRGELIFSSQVAEFLSMLAADLAARHDAVAGRIANEFAGISDPAIIRSRALDELRGVRGAIADTAGKLADALGSDPALSEDHDAAAEEDGGDVGGREPSTPARKRRARTVEK